jgi:hypothetical protein
MLIDDDDDTPISKLLLAQKSKNGKEAAPGDSDNSDDDSVTEILHSPSLKQHPAVAKLARGRQHKPFSPSGNQTAII